MKKNFKLLMMAALLLTGCEALEMNQTGIRSDEFQAVTADFGSTKTALSGRQIIWNEGDEISVYQTYPKPDRFILSQGAGQTSGTFKLVSAAENQNTWGKYFALYPYDTNNYMRTSKNIFTVQKIAFATNQTYRKDSFDTNLFPMFAITSSVKDYTLAFKNFGGILNLQLTGKSKIKELVLKGNSGEALSGLADFTIDSNNRKTKSLSDEIDLDKAFTYDGINTAASIAINLNCGDGVQLDEKTPISFMFVLPPVTFEKGFNVRITDADGNTQIIKTDKKNIIHRSGVTTMPVVKFNPEVKIAEDLSLSGNANSYIVSKAGTYKFPLLKGNSRDAVGEVKEAVVLWETFGTSTSPNLGDLVRGIKVEDGYIVFSTPERMAEGNALIAAKDAAGNILWSWHIWLVEDAIAEHIYANNAGVAMDRNLGATSAEPGDVASLGLLYQWGRKDPFLGSAAIDKATKCASTLKTWPVVQSDTDKGTIAYAIQNPTTLIQKNDADWYQAVDGNTADDRWNKNKTIYDPCPAGWKVPSGGYRGLWRPAGFDGNKPDMTRKGYLFPASVSGSEAWYPMAGNIVYGQLNHTGLFGNYWSVDSFIHSKTGAIQSFHLHLREAFVQSQAGNSRTNAYSIRCVKE